MKYLPKTLLLFAFLFTGNLLKAQTEAGPVNAAPNPRTFQLVNPDFKTSPQTGMTRKHWKDAAHYLLTGAFSYVKTLDDPMVFPKQPGKSYPRDGVHTNTEMLEGLCRTLFMAAPLLKENPDLQINGLQVAEYYRHQLVKLTDPTSPTYVKPRAKNGGANQILVEFGALAISLFNIPEVLWAPLTPTQKEALANTMLSYGDGPTIASNWRFFNIFVLSFFQEQGYQVNEKLMQEYLDKSLEQYRGQGWYHDSPAYDYYSMWAFQVYGPLWAEFFGRKHYPAYAARFMDNFKEVKDNYPHLFGRDGKMIMWGRSISYRFAAAGPFPLMAFAQEPGTNYGWMRRIASGNMLQFLQNPHFIAPDNLPTLGFYGPFEPAVQIYSARPSVFWMGKIFLGLLVPEDHPFWTVKENEGAWEKELRQGHVYNKFQEGSKLLITNYPNIGASEVRAWCHETVAKDWQQFRSTENYNRLAYNSAFPWQADGAQGEVAMNYVFKNKKNAWEALRLYTFRKFEDGVYYRDVVLETSDKIKLNLADITLPNGILRIDRNLSTEATQVRLGHYALPQKNGPIKETSRTVKAHPVKIIDNGEYQLAMVSLLGWENLETVNATGLHPESQNSSVINATDSFVPGQQPKVYATLMLWKRSGEKWTDKELVPVQKIEEDPTGKTLTVSFRKGDQKTVRFD
ncbi:DUF2264 domain-containing protein [Rufibacter glacialis]|uniref:DUF2264 domain-containing protein n=1 Tax=Rufibacter glacialis TaxID=1259555 RepID=A0A5M8QFG5_9BACT|nr:DUF2264 domain-containing protein [Rufibacter glacialis]KAA6434777.1 DUF2264 domain-containing protein [Rufibacter glacialis]GGK72341.1 hypothetical protein GCM10011405_20720 [Rufibacter glacialis]